MIKKIIEYESQEFKHEFDKKKDATKDFIKTRIQSKLQNTINGINKMINQVDKNPILIKEGNEQTVKTEEQAPEPEEQALTYFEEQARFKQFLETQPG